MRILLLTHSFNGLARRLHCELRERDHEVSVELDVQDGVTVEAVELFEPEVVVAPYLKRMIPERIWSRVPCLVVHPGPPGDRGPSALDRAILRGEESWGVTVLQADDVPDGGPIWAHRTFPMREATKSSIYRNEVTEAAVAAVLEALGKLAGGASPDPGAGENDRFRPLLPASGRTIDWTVDPTEVVLRRIRSADGSPGVLDELRGRAVRLHDARPETFLEGSPGELIARRRGAVCRATVDGAVWIGRLRAEDGREPKLPAARVLGDAIADLPEVDAPAGAEPGQTYLDIRYEEEGDVGHLHFPFHNGAMSTGQCERLLAAYREALERPTRVLVLHGGPDFWSNGIHLATIEAAPSPADESWRNIRAIDRVARAILETTDRVTVAALAGGAGAGGAFLALTADRVIAREGIVLNPHYKAMGNLHGSEYWTYTLPRRVGTDRAEEIVEARLPVGTAEALRLGLVDDVLPGDVDAFRERLTGEAEALAADPAFPARLEEKARRRAADEAEKPLDAYRDEELERMHLSFYGFDPSYHVARYNFIFDVPKSRTPPHLAVHRRHVGKLPTRGGGG